MSTTRGIQSESLEKASASSATTAAANDGTSGGTVLATAATTEAQVQAALFLGEDADRDVQPADDRVEIRPEDRAPSAPGRTAAGRPARSGTRRAGARSSSTSDARVPSPRSSPSPAANDASRPASQVVVARPVAEDPVVDQLAQRSERRVLVGDADQQQLFEAVDGRFGLRPDAREGGGEAIEDEVGVGIARVGGGCRGARRPSSPR